MHFNTPLRPWHLLMVAAAAAGLTVPVVAAPEAPPPAPARGLPDNQLSPLSLAMLRTGETQLNARQFTEAMDSFESALAADPRNRNAWLGMARVAVGQGLPGKAIRYYREALAIDPNDVAVLSLQGTVMVERGAKARAEANLDRIHQLCAAPCPPADRLAAAIARGPTTPPPTAIAKADPAAAPAADPVVTK